MQDVAVDQAAIASKLEAERIQREADEAAEAAWQAVPEVDKLLLYLNGCYSSMVELRGLLVLTADENVHTSPTIRAKIEAAQASISFAIDSMRKTETFDPNSRS